MIDLKISNHHHFKNQFVACEKCHVNRTNLFKHLITTAVNICANNMTMILNRVDGAKKHSLRMVKTQKKKDECVKLTKDKNNEDNHFTWSYSKCNEYLKEKGVIKTGKLEALRRRCNLHHLLVQKNLQHVLNLTKTEAREACESLSLLEGSRADMVEKIGHALLNNSNVADDGFVLLMDRDDDTDEAVNMQFVVI